MKKSFVVLQGFIMIMTLTFLGGSTAWGVPDTISYQGVLKDKEGNLFSGRVSMNFRLYNRETEGEILWEETLSS